MTDKELIEKIAHWRKHDFGACACLGNCKRCGYHMCHGCLCFVLDELESRANERQAVLAEVLEWSKARQYSDEYGVDVAIRFSELRAKLAEMKEGNGR